MTELEQLTKDWEPVTDLSGTNEFIQSILDDFEKGLMEFNGTWVADTLKNTKGILIAHHSLWKIDNCLREIWYQSTLADAMHSFGSWGLCRALSHAMMVINRQKGEIQKGATNFRVSQESTEFDHPEVADKMAEYVNNASLEVKWILRQLVTIRANLNSP